MISKNFESRLNVVNSRVEQPALQAAALSTAANCATELHVICGKV